MAAALIGTPANRVDGRLKVTGAAKYAAESLSGNTVTHAALVGSPVAGGRIKTIHDAKAKAVPGVLLVLTSDNRGPLGKLPTGLGQSGGASEDRLPLDDDRIHYAGQYVAMVVAETFEQACHAASLLEKGAPSMSFGEDDYGEMSMLTQAGDVLKFAPAGGRGK